MDLGRYQRGQVVSLGLTIAGFPDAPPAATIADPDAGPVATLELPYRGQRSAGQMDFLLTFRVGPLTTLGTYRVTYLWTQGGTPTTATDTFDLVAGGDSGGEVISLYYYERPEAAYVVAQLGGGKLVQGRNPHL